MASLRSLFRRRDTRSDDDRLSRISTIDPLDDSIIDLESQPRPRFDAAGADVLRHPAAVFEDSAPDSAADLDPPAPAATGPRTGHGDLGGDGAKAAAAAPKGIAPLSTAVDAVDARGAIPPRTSAQVAPAIPPQPTPPATPPDSPEPPRARSFALSELPRRKPEMVPIDAADGDGFARTMMSESGDRLIGDMLRQTGQLSAEQVQAILEHQKTHRTRFGESAVALGYVKGSDVLWALSRQFGYDYAPDTVANSASFSDDLVVAKHPFSRAAETIRDLRSQLLLTALNPDQLPRRALGVVSLNSGDGKSWFAANLAVSLSQLGSRTLLVDANLRAPRLHTLFGIDDPRTGLSGILSRRHKADVMRPVRELPHLYLLPAGVVPPNPLEIVQGRGFLDLLTRLRTKFTHVIVDTPALDAGADARVIAARCGASVIVGRRHHSSMPMLQEAARHLGKGDGLVAGIVMNDI